MSSVEIKTLLRSAVERGPVPYRGPVQILNTLEICSGYARPHRGPVEKLDHIDVFSRDLDPIEVCSRDLDPIEVCSRDLDSIEVCSRDTRNYSALQ